MNRYFQATKDVWLLPTFKQTFQWQRRTSSVSVSVCVSPISLLGNGSVKALPRQRIHTNQ
jgi:hypothetical protein